MAKSLLSSVSFGLAIVANLSSAWGFEIDVTGKELRNRLQSWELQDLAVGESGYVFGPVAFCIRDDELYVDSGANLVERSGYGTAYRVTLMPNRNAEVEILPPTKEKRAIDRSDLDTFASLSDCSTLKKLRDLTLIRIESVNGESRLSDVLDKYLKDKSGAAPSDANDEDTASLEKRFADLVGDQGDQSWRVEEDVSKIDDSRNVFMYLSARNRIWSGFRMIRPSLVIRCMEDTTAIYFRHEMHLGFDDVQATLRIDTMKAHERTMRISTDREAFGFWRGKTAIPFIKSLFGKDNLLVRVTPSGKSPVTAEFAITNLQEKIQPLREACHWPPKKTARTPAKPKPANSTDYNNDENLLESLGPLPDWLQ